MLARSIAPLQCSNTLLQHSRPSILEIRLAPHGRTIQSAFRSYREQSGHDVEPPSGQFVPSRPGEFHPESLTEPDVSLSTYPARAIARRLPPSIGQWVPPVAG